MIARNIFVLISLFFTISNAGVAGSGGGSQSKPKYQLVTVMACDTGESGNECRTIRYYDRPKTHNFAPECYVYHGEAQVPCPVNYGTKGTFIQDMIKTFVNQGYNTKIVVQTL